MPGRSYSSNSYRYGFGGHEKDDEVKGSGNHLSFGDYGYDPRTGRRWRPDPYESSYVPISPYSYALNNPIKFTDSDGNIVVDRLGHPVTISIIEAENGTVTATFEFSEGTSEETKNDFYANGGNIIKTLIQTPTGRDQVDKVIKSSDKIHTKIVSIEKVPNETYSSEGIKLGGTKIMEKNILDKNGVRTGGKEDVIEIRIFEGSIKQAIRNTDNPDLVQDPNSQGNLLKRLTKEQQNAAVAAHEFEHATNTIDVSLLKQRKALPANDSRHKAAYNKGNTVANELDKINKQ